MQPSDQHINVLSLNQWHRDTSQ